MRRGVRRGSLVFLIVGMLVLSLACRRTPSAGSETPAYVAPTAGATVAVPAPVASDAPGTSATPAPVAVQRTATPLAGPGTSRGIVEAGFEEPRTLNPLFVADPLSEALSRLLFDGLVALDPATGQPVPALAESWEVSADGTVYTFHLRQGVRWHDGQPFSAIDVVFTYQRLLDPDVRSPRYSRLAERVKSVELVDSDTVRITLIRPDASFLPTLGTIGIVPEHVLGTVLPQQLVTDPFGLSSAVGTGPFMFGQWMRGVSLTLRTNPDYYRGAPRVPQYTYRVVSTLEELQQGLADGTIDWAVVDAAQVGQFAVPRGVVVERYPGYELVLVAFQLDPAKSKLFADPRVRQALMLGTDRATLVDKVWGDRARVAEGLQPPASWAAGEPPVRYAYDPAEAQRLLEEAGWVPGDDGIRVREGQRLQFRLLATGTDSSRRAVAELLQQQWRAIGVAVDLELASWAEVRRRATQERDFDALLIGVLWDVDPDQSAVWSSDSFFDGLNFGHYLNSEVDQQLVEAVATTDRAQRTERYRAIEEQVLRDLPVLPIAFPDVVVVRSERLQVPVLNALVVRTRVGIEQWNLEGGR
ncbi:MAG: ABC transporter substrate-binding protein [Thermomicrobium sp.]|nr:ABC transporter substrate-binding protein [Thermomicrobium sp.]